MIKTSMPTDRRHAPGMFVTRDAHAAPATAAAPDAVADRPSKTRLKQQAHELQDLGEALTAFPPETRWLEAHPGADAQRLRALVRNARKDAAQEAGARNGRAYRELFQFIRAEEGETP